MAPCPPIKQSSLCLILRFSHRLERRKLADRMLATVNDFLKPRGLLPRAGTAVGAMFIPAPSSTKNEGKGCGLELHSGWKSRQWYLA